MPFVKSEYGHIKPYITKDGSYIRELMHPDVHGNTKLSLAEAVVPAGRATLLHRHCRSEEVYHFTWGAGELVLGSQSFEVRAGDTVWIPAGVSHGLRNTGHLPLRVLCCCAPPYTHDDTELLETQGRDPSA